MSFMTITSFINIKFDDVDTEIVH